MVKTESKVSDEELDEFIRFASMLPGNVKASAKLAFRIATELQERRTANSDGGVEPKPVAWTRAGSLSILKDHWPMVEVIDASFEEAPTFNTPLFLHPPAKALDGIAVKALEWSNNWGTIKAETSIGHYFIDDSRDGGFKVRLEDIWSSWASTPEKAKASAQADYDQRIRSALAVR